MADTAYVSDIGLGLITAALVASTHKYIGWGTGGTTTTTAATATNTALEIPAAEARTTNTGTQAQTTTLNDTYQVTGTITCATAAKAITEVGVFSATTAGSMLLRATFSPINVSVGDSVAFTIKVVFDQV